MVNFRENYFIRDPKDNGILYQVFTKSILMHMEFQFFHQVKYAILLYAVLVTLFVLCWAID